MARKSSVQQRRLSRLLRRVEPEIVEPIKEVVAEAAQELLLAAESEIPVDSGVARNQMTAKASRSGLTAEVGFLTKTARKLAFYAAFVHFGTKGAPKKNIPPMPANPFLFGPAERLRAGFIKRIDATVDKALERIARGL
jgi:hypothetical protein